MLNTFIALWSKIKANSRFRNPVFWIQVIGAGLLAALGYNSLQPQSLTTWSSVWKLLVDTINNPYLLALVLWNIWCAYNNPKTKGLTDGGEPLDKNI